MKVALDAMGGDNAPAVNIGGAKEALQLYPAGFAGLSSQGTGFKNADGPQVFIYS